MTDLIDVSEEMAALDEVWRQGEVLQRLTESLPVGVVEVDLERRTVYANELAGELLGTERAEPIETLRLLCGDDDRERIDTLLDQALQGGGDGEIEVRSEPEAGVLRSVIHVVVKALRGRAGEVSGALVCLDDVTDRAMARDELHHRASVDPLTGLLNRGEVLRAITSELGRLDGATALVYVDLDGFKEINDRWGHAAGDAVLCSVAETLCSVVRSGDLVGRVGGDEFVVHCPNVVDPVQASEVGQRLASSLRYELQASGDMLAVRASVGVAWAPNHTVTADHLLGRADSAMYVAKARGDGRCELHSPEGPAPG